VDDRSASAQAGKNGRGGCIHLCHMPDVDVQAQGLYNQRWSTSMFETTHIHGG
jgi:hypothetical protein